ncbi:MAG: hypothetical protein AAB883_00670 [Patescibacteria group bacterium]
MNTNKNLKIVIGVLVVLLIIVTGLWVRAAGYFSLGAEDLAAQRNRIEKLCNTPEKLNSSDCIHALGDLSSLLKKFNTQLEKERKANAPAPVATSTVPGVGGQ